MLDLFIPIRIHKYWNIQKISDNFLSVLATTFLEYTLIHFESDFFFGYKIVFPYFDEDIISLCNWEFWSRYYVDFDVLEHRGVSVLWKHIAKESWLWDNLETTLGSVWKITEVLQSNALMTVSKKEKIIWQIEDSFFALSHIDYLLSELISKTDENLSELKGWWDRVEYGSQKILLDEQNRIFQEKLLVYKKQFNTRIEEFITIVSKFIK